MFPEECEKCAICKKYEDRLNWMRYAIGVALANLQRDPTDIFRLTTNDLILHLAFTLEHDAVSRSKVISCGDGNHIFIKIFDEYRCVICMVEKSEDNLFKFKKERGK
jgi:hypothetical protein